MLFAYTLPKLTYENLLIEAMALLVFCTLPFSFYTNSLARATSLKRARKSLAWVNTAECKCSVASVWSSLRWWSIDKKFALPSVMSEVITASLSKLVILLFNSREVIWSSNTTSWSFVVVVVVVVLVVSLFVRSVLSFLLCAITWVRYSFTCGA